MARGSAFVFASRLEGFGIVLVEALACGLPVVAVDCPSGPREILQDGRYGVLVPAGDASTLADSLGKLLADPGRMASLRALGPQRARDFSIDHAADTLMGILQGLGNPSTHGPVSPGTGASRLWP
jgi:glycosyltransferase involved in cell wall biosynthesis